MGCGSSVTVDGDGANTAPSGQASDGLTPVPNAGLKVLPNMNELLQGARVPQADCIIPLLYLGNVSHARDKEKLQALGIQRIVNVTSQPASFPSLFKYENCPVEDLQGANIAQHLKEAGQFIADGIDAGETVFVHCEMGMSRSTTIVAAYLMVHKGWSLRRAILQTKLARPIVRVTKSFLHELMEIEAQLVRSKSLDLALLIEEGMEDVATGADEFSLTSNVLQLLFFPTPEVVEGQLRAIGLYTPEWSTFKEKFFCGVDMATLESQRPAPLNEITEALEAGSRTKAVCKNLLQKYPSVSPFVK